MDINFEKYRKDDIERKLQRANFRPIDIMVAGVTGAGKSTTLNSLFHKEVAKVGNGASPETMRFVMSGSEGSLMTNSEILAVSKILLASRAFTKKEISSILKKMIGGCVPLKNMELVRELISNEQFHYVELHHKSHIQDRLWQIGEDIREQNLMEIKYAKADQPDETVTRLIEPVALLFSEYYFYLNAFILEEDGKGGHVHKYDYPAIFRIDRIKDYKETGEKFHVSYADRFELGEFRKRIQFMYAGELMRIQLKYYGDNPEPVLDRLPTAQIIGQKEHEYTINAEVYGKGIVMWLLSQGSRIEVIRPESLRQEMKEKAEEIVELYGICEVLGKEILRSDADEKEKQVLLARLRKLCSTRTNIMLVGATGCGKSSTINALFSCSQQEDGYVEVARVGSKADPETRDIERFRVGNLILWDTPGLGDGTEIDGHHREVITELLREEDGEGNALIDLVLVILDGSTRDLGTSYKILNEVIIPELNGETERILIALNQADIAMKTGRHWDYEKNEPDDTLKTFLEESFISWKEEALYPILPASFKNGFAVV